MIKENIIAIINAAGMTLLVLVPGLAFVFGATVLNIFVN